MAPRKRYLVGQFLHFGMSANGPPGNIELRNPYIVSGRGNPPRNKKRNLRTQFDNGFTHFKQIHAGLEKKRVGETFNLILTTASGVKKTFTYKKMAEGDYRQINNVPKPKM